MMATEHRECNQSQSKCKQTRTNVHVLDTNDYKLDHFKLQSLYIHVNFFNVLPMCNCFLHWSVIVVSNISERPNLKPITTLSVT